MELREYPPAPLIHCPDCAGIAQGAFPVLATPEIARRFPTGKPHFCYDFRANANGAVEPVVYPEHDYVPSTIKPADAVRFLCRSCRGTHGDEQVDGGGQLLLPGVRQRILLPGERILLPGETASGGLGVVILPGNR
jgi:hypothetical protein